MTELSVRPIGRVSSERTEPLDDGWDSIVATITLDAEQFGPEALQGLDAFSHVEVVYLFDRVDPGSVQTAARRPPWQPGLAAGRDLRPAGEGPSQPARRLGVPAPGCAGPDGHRSRTRRDRRHTGPGPQAVHGGVRPPRTGAPARVVSRAHGAYWDASSEAGGSR